MCEVPLLVTCRTDATVKHFLAFRLGEVTASGEGLASELHATKVRQKQHSCAGGFSAK